MNPVEGLREGVGGELRVQQDAVENHLGLRVAELPTRLTEKHCERAREQESEGARERRQGCASELLFVARKIEVRG